MRRFIAITVALALSGTIAAQGKRPIAETDLLKFIWIADPQISPDGAAVAFTRVAPPAPPAPAMVEIGD